jgi:hypothetical protein
LIFILVLSYNQPKLCPDASWNPNATTFASSNIIGSMPHGIFINRINTIYVNSQDNKTISVWDEGSARLTITISRYLNDSYGLFVSITDDLYVGNGDCYRRYGKRWLYDPICNGRVMTIHRNCYSLFVDINDTLYCSLESLHQVVKSSLYDRTHTLTIAAGSGSAGSTSNMLNSPRGIFVNINFDLYIADCYNNRVQLFRSGELNGITMAGNEASGNILLNCPTGIVLDADDYLFIVDSKNHRIIGSGPNGFRCVVGCSGLEGSESDQLFSPQNMAFDSYGNLYVTDRNNNRIQKFRFDTISCGKSFNVNPMNK